jgi:hypothetical protein
MSAFKIIALSLRSRRQHKAWGVSPSRALVKLKAHEVGDSQMAAARSTGLIASNPDPGFRLRLHPGLYALIITHIFLFAPEAQRKLAGGETTGKPVIIAFAPWQGRRTGV